MNCPYCNQEIKKGVLEVSGRLFSNSVSWYPDEEKKKIFHNDLVHLKHKAEAHYCNNCKKVIAIFDEK